MAPFMEQNELFWRIHANLAPCHWAENMFSLNKTHHVRNYFIHVITTQSKPCNFQNISSIEKNISHPQNRFYI